MKFSVRKFLKLSVLPLLLVVLMLAAIPAQFAKADAPSPTSVSADVNMSVTYHDSDLRHGDTSLDNRIMLNQFYLAEFNIYGGYNRSSFKMVLNPEISDDLSYYVCIEYGVNDGMDFLTSDDTLSPQVAFLLDQLPHGSGVLPIDFVQWMRDFYGVSSFMELEGMQYLYDHLFNFDSILDDPTYRTTKNDKWAADPGTELRRPKMAISYGLWHEDPVTRKETTIYTDAELLEWQAARGLTNEANFEAVVLSQIIQATAWHFSRGGEAIVPPAVPSVWYDQYIDAGGQRNYVALPWMKDLYEQLVAYCDPHSDFKTSPGTFTMTRTGVSSDGRYLEYRVDALNDNWKDLKVEISTGDVTFENGSKSILLSPANNTFRVLIDPSVDGEFTLNASSFVVKNWISALTDGPGKGQDQLITYSNLAMSIELEMPQSWQLTPPPPPPVPTYPKLEIVKEVSRTGEVKVGDSITYTLTVKNVGDGAASNVRITDVVPAGTTYVEDSATNGATVKDGILSYNVGTMQPGASASCSFTVIVNESAKDMVHNVAVVKDDNGSTDSNPIDNPVVSPEPEVEIGDPGTPQSGGEDLPEPEVPQDPFPGVPQTGDSGFMHYALLTLAAAGSLAVLVLGKKSKSN